MYVPCRRRHFVLLCVNTGWTLMKFVGRNHCHQQIKWLHFVENWTRDKRAGYNGHFKSTSNRYCHVASECGGVIWQHIVLCCRWTWCVYFMRCWQRLLQLSLWRDPDDVSHCRILCSDKTEWRLILATLCGWRRCFLADQLWLMTRMRVEKDFNCFFSVRLIWFW